MARTPATSQHTVRQGAGGDVPVGLGHLVIDGDDLKIASEGPADAFLVVDGDDILIDESASENEGAMILLFGDNARIKE